MVNAKVETMIDQRALPDAVFPVSAPIKLLTN